MKMQCVDCKCIAREELFKGLRCRACVAREEQVNTAIMEKHNIQDACKELTRAISRDEVRDLPAIIERFKAKVGGAEKIADMLVEDFQRVRGGYLSEDEKKDFIYRDQVIQRYHQMMMRALANNDETKSSDMSTLSEEDLKSIVTSVALDLVKNDKNFRVSLARQAIKDSPELLLEIQNTVLLEDDHDSIEDLDSM